jgi:hypothetical protein
MRDYLEIDTVPTEEDCAQVGAADYHARAAALGHFLEPEPCKPFSNS